MSRRTTTSRTMARGCRTFPGLLQEFQDCCKNTKISTRVPLVSINLQVLPSSFSRNSSSFSRKRSNAEQHDRWLGCDIQDFGTWLGYEVLQAPCRPSTCSRTSVGQIRDLAGRLGKVRSQDERLGRPMHHMRWEVGLRSDENLCALRNERL